MRSIRFFFAEEGADFLAAGQERHPPLWQDALRGLAHYLGEGLIRYGGFASSLEQGGIAGLEAQGGDLHQGVGPGFKDHADHADGHGHAVEVELVV